MNDVISDVNPDSGLSILEGILTAAGFKDDPDCWERINISRGGEKLFSFRIRPLDEQEVADLRRQCTRFLPNPNGAGRDLDDCRDNKGKLAKRVFTC